MLRNGGKYMFLLVSSTVPEELFDKVFELVRIRADIPLSNYDIDATAMTMAITHYDDILFIIVEDKDGCRVKIRNRYRDGQKEFNYEADSCKHAIYIIYDHIIKYRYANRFSNETLDEIKYLMTTIIRDALLLSNIVFDPLEKDMHYIIEEIVKEMLKSTTYYNKFASPLVEVTKEPDESDLTTTDIKIRFYNGSEENYNPSFIIKPDKHDKEYLEMIKEVINPESKRYTEDPSCGFHMLLYQVVKATTENLNQVLAKSGFRDFFSMDMNNYLLFSTRAKNPMDVQYLARNCVLKGIVNYIWKYIPNEYSRGKERWDWMFGEFF